MSHLSTITHPLNKIFCKGTPWVWNTARLQRWAIFLLGYQYDLEFRPTGKHCNADGFSHLPRMSQAGEEEELEFGATTCKSLQFI